MARFEEIVHLKYACSSKHTANNERQEAENETDFLIQKTNEDENGKLT